MKAMKWCNVSDSYSWILVFSGEDEEREFLMLQYQKQATPEDRALGLNGIYLETGTGICGYDLVTNIVVSEDSVVVKLCTSRLPEGQVGCSEFNIDISRIRDQFYEIASALEVFRVGLSD